METTIFAVSEQDMKRYGLMSKVLEGKLTLAAAKPANFRKNVPSPQDWVLIFKLVGKVRAFSSAMRGIFFLERSPQLAAD
jgi:hypothetical protein